MSDEKELSCEIDSILKKASEEILNKQSGHCFTVENIEPNFNEDYSPYVKKDLEEFINFDMLGEESDNLESFSNILTSTNHEDLTGDRSVLKILLDPGIGQVVPENYIVFLHYIAYISNLHEPFDVTYLQGKRPKRFTLGNYELLPGLEIGVKTMRIGENARFIVSPELAYREMGCPPRIPPNATILFDVHLVSYLSPENSLLYDKDSRDPERFNISMVQVKKIHKEGNELFKLRNIERAIFKYEKAIELLHLTGCNSDDEEVEIMKYLNKLYTNLSLCYLKQCAFNKVCRMGIEAMKYSERFSKFSTKLFFNWGKALRLLKDFSEANNKLKKALKLEPKNVSILDEIKMLEKDREFNKNIHSFTFLDQKYQEDENVRWPPSFWEVFHTRLSEFVNGDDDILTVNLNNNLDDIELVKRKVSTYNLKWHIIQKAGVESKSIAIQKIEE
uniref:peptidylprolyl isomerase n=1 Tax=Sipha flava TaxID=143950 RepID=A0A2S2Q1C7_9HEMI